MAGKNLLIVIGLVLLPLALSAQEKPVIVVHSFTVASDAAWPYDAKQMQTQTVAELTAKLGKDFQVATEVPPAPHGKVYILNGEVTGWRPGNAAKRKLVGLGSGRESADIHYWVTDESGEKVVQQKDTIRTEYYAKYDGSVGQLAHPFADKIAGRIKDAKLK